MRVFPLWARTLGAMIDEGCKVRAICDRCHEWKDVDITALAARVGPEYSLINRRCPCRLRQGCAGWNRFYILLAVYRPLWTDERSKQWTLEDLRRRGG